MSTEAAVQIILAVATLVSALAALASSIKNGSRLTETRTMLDGQADQLAMLHEAKGFSAGTAAAAAAPATGAAPAVATRELPPTASP